jgi:hypothetical protein
MAYRSRDGKMRPYKETPSQYRARKEFNSVGSATGFITLFLIIVFFIWYDVILNFILGIIAISVLAVVICIVVYAIFMLQSYLVSEKIERPTEKKTFEIEVQGEEQITQIGKEMPLLMESNTTPLNELPDDLNKMPKSTIEELPKVEAQANDGSKLMDCECGEDFALSKGDVKYIYLNKLEKSDVAKTVSRTLSSKNEITNDNLHLLYMPIYEFESEYINDEIYESIFGTKEMLHNEALTDLINEEKIKVQSCVGVKFDKKRKIYENRCKYSGEPLNVWEENADIFDIFKVFHDRAFSYLWKLNFVPSGYALIGYERLKNFYLEESKVSKAEYVKSLYPLWFYYTDCETAVCVNGVSGSTKIIYVG